MKRQSLLVVSFALLCCGSVFSQELGATKVAKEKPAQKEEKGLNRATPISQSVHNEPLKSKTNSKGTPAKKEAQPIDRKTIKSPKKTVK